MMRIAHDHLHGLPPPEFLDHVPGEPCAGCLHAYDDEAGAVLPTASVFSFWAGLALAIRFVRKEMGKPYPKDHQALWLVPLRMDSPSAGFWSAVSPRPDCPVKCPLAQWLKVRR